MILTLADLRAIPPRWWRRFFTRCAVLLVLFGMLTPAPPVAASGTSSGGSVGVCSASAAGDGQWSSGNTDILTGDGQDALESFADACLPGRRWLEGFSVLHSRLDADAWNDLGAKTGQGAAGTVLSFAQLLTGARSNILSWALYSKSVFITSTVTIDRVWAKVGEALWDSGIFEIAILFAVASAAWKWFFRNKMMSFRSVSKDIVVALLVFWCFAGLLGEAQRSSAASGHALTCGVDDRGFYRCQEAVSMSPGALTRDFIAGIDALAAAPASALSTSFEADGSGGGMDDLPEPWRSDPLNCTTVTDHMRQTFTDVAASKIGTADAIEPVALLVDDRLTMETLGRTWGLAQGGGSPAFDRVSCLLLEWNSQTHSPTEMAAFFQAAGAGWDNVGAWDRTGDDNPYNMRSDGQQRDVRFIAWMACSIDSNNMIVPLSPWGPGSGRAGVDVDAATCAAFLNEGNDGGSDGGAFDYEEDGSGNDVTSTSPDASLLVNTTESWQGHRPGMSLGASLIAALTALILLIVNAFGALGCIVSMLTIVIGVPVVGPIVLAIAAFPGRTSLVRKFGRRIGFAACARALFVLQLSMLAAVGQMVLELWPGPGGQWGVLWRGLVWIGSAAVVHTAAKMSKTPSLLTPSGAFAFGAGSAVGGAVIASKVGRSPARARQSIANRRQRSYIRDRHKAIRKGTPLPGQGPSRGRGTGRGGDGQTGTEVDGDGTGNRRRGVFATRAGAAAATLRNRGQRLLRGEEGSRQHANWTDRQTERSRRRALNGQRHEEMQARRDARRTERTEQRRAVSDAKWSRRRERLGGTLDTVADTVTGRATAPDYQATVDARRARRAAATDEVNAATDRYRRGSAARRSDAWRDVESEVSSRVNQTRGAAKRSRWSSNRPADIPSFNPPPQRNP